MQESGDSVGFPDKLRGVWPPFGHFGERGKNADRALALSKEHEPKKVTFPALERCRGTAAACLASRSLAAPWESDAGDFIRKKKFVPLMVRGNERGRVLFPADHGVFPVSWTIHF